MFKRTLDDLVRADPSTDFGKGCWEKVLSSWMPGDPYQPEPLTPNTYVAKALISQWIKPDSVLEIGVRAGYSAVAMRYGHAFSVYLGVDADNGCWGGEVGFCEHAGKLLKEMSGLQWEIHIGDSHLLETVHHDGQPFDLAHVDGDHSLDGAIQDIELCLRSGVKFIAVDDFDFIADVRVAVVKMINEHHLNYRFFSDDGYRGTMVLWKPDTPAPK